MLEFLKKLFAGPPSIDIVELDRLLTAGEVRLIDVREPAEFKSGHVPGAINVPLGRIDSQIPKLKKDKPYAVICQSGHRSNGGVRILMDAGFTDAVSVQGGTGAWGRSGRKLVR